jgi:CRP-like cAMP-binding protein
VAVIAAVAQSGHFSKRAVLETVPLFAKLPPNLLTVLVRRCDAITATSDTVLIHEDKPVERFYVLVRGAIRLLHNNRAVKTHENAGDAVGLASVLQRRAAPVGAVVAESAVLLRFRATEFWRLAETSPEFMPALASGLVAMLVDLCPDAFAS